MYAHSVLSAGLTIEAGVFILSMLRLAIAKFIANKAFFFMKLA